MPRVLLFHNPKAGQKSPSAEELIDALRRAGHEPFYQCRKLPDLQCALDVPHDLVVIAGGDGTVTEILRLCTGHAAPVAILPIGTANNVAAGLGHVGDVEGLIRRWDPQAHRPFYAGLARSDWGQCRFVESFGIGALAEMIAGGHREETDDSDDTATKLDATLEGLRRTIQHLPPQAITLQANGQTFKGDFLWLEITRVGMVGPNLPLIGSPDPWKPELDLVLLPADERQRCLEYLDQFAHGSHPKHSGLIHLRVPSARIISAAEAVQIDGSRLSTALTQGRVHDMECEIYSEPANVLTLKPEQ
jgi:diacylglycerol kinase family enzyme